MNIISNQFKVNVVWVKWTIGKWDIYSVKLCLFFIFLIRLGSKNLSFVDLSLLWNKDKQLWWCYIASYISIFCSRPLVMTKCGHLQHVILCICSTEQYIIAYVCVYERSFVKEYWNIQEIQLTLTAMISLFYKVTHYRKCPCHRFHFCTLYYSLDVAH